MLSCDKFDPVILELLSWLRECARHGNPASVEAYAKSVLVLVQARSYVYRPEASDSGIALKPAALDINP